MNQITLYIIFTIINIIVSWIAIRLLKSSLPFTFLMEIGLLLLIFGAVEEFLQASTAFINS